MRSAHPLSAADRATPRSRATPPAPRRATGGPRRAALPKACRAQARMGLGTRTWVSLWSHSASDGARDLGEPLPSLACPLTY